MNQYRQGLRYWWQELPVYVVVLIIVGGMGLSGYMIFHPLPKKEGQMVTVTCPCGSVMHVWVPPKPEPEVVVVPGFRLRLKGEPRWSEEIRCG